MPLAGDKFRSRSWVKPVPELLSAAALSRAAHGSAEAVLEGALQSVERRQGSVPGTRVAARLRATVSTLASGGGRGLAVRPS